jgi:cytoskeleton protein RodZ
MSAATASEIRSGVGARLKAGRERMGLTLLQVAEKLHVDAKVLEALEADRFDQLGAPVYARGHIKRYSELVSENAVELLDYYSSVTKPVLPDLTQLPKATHHADPRKLVLPSLVVLIAFAVVGTVWWVLQNFDSAVPVAPEPVPLTSEGETATTESGDAPGVDSATPSAAELPAPVASIPGRQQAVPTAPAAVASSARPSGAGRASSAQATGAASPAKASGAAAAKRAPSVVGTPPPRAGTTAGAVSSVQISKAALKAAAAAADTPRAKSVNVTLKFSADSWVEVYDANGQRLFYDIGSANSSHAVSGTPPLRVVLGNAPSVSLNINGKPAKVPASAMQDSGAQFSINRSGRIVRTRPDGG